MEEKWITTEQLLKELHNDHDVEHEYTHYIGGLLRATHWLIYDSAKQQFGDSTDWYTYDWYTEEELQDYYAGHWWHLDV